MNKTNDWFEKYEEEERKRKEHFNAQENAKPWIERIAWRRRDMYRGWAIESIVEQVGESAAVTRSHYGYRVLNTRDLGFVDVDFNLDYHTFHQQSETLSKVREWVASHPGQSWRTYRTAGGMRLMRTDAPLPIDAEFDGVCAAVGADELYRDICREEQRCFRARVSPKPDRIGVRMPHWNPYNPPNGFEFSDPGGTGLPAAITNYEIRAAKFKTCELVETIGSGIVCPDLQVLVDFHDVACKIKTDLPLESEHCRRLTWMEVLKFNEKYRPNRMADDLLWNMLDGEVQSKCRQLDNPSSCEMVRAAHQEAHRLYRKWAKEYEAHLKAERKDCETAFAERLKDEGDLSDEDFFKNLAGDAPGTEAA